MYTHREIVLVAFAALYSSCGTPPSRPVKPELGAAAGMPPPPAGFAAADLVTMSGGELATYKIDAGRLVRTGTTTLVKVNPENEAYLGHGDWVDRDHLMVTIGPRDVVMVTASAASRIAVPPSSEFETARPTVRQDWWSEDEPRRGNAGEIPPSGGGNWESSGLIVTDDAATWRECAWEVTADGTQCVSWVQARLWPTPAPPAPLPQNQPRLEARSWRWPAATPTKTMPLTCRTETEETETEDEGAGSAMDSSNDKVMGEHWVSSNPPRLLAIHGTMGLGDYQESSWVLSAGCDTEVIAHGSTTTPGPAGLWLAHDHHTGPPNEDDAPDDDNPAKTMLYRGATAIGELPSNVRVMLRPAQ